MGRLIMNKKLSELPIGQQRIAVLHPADEYPILNVQPEWTDSLVWTPGYGVMRMEHDYRQSETVAEAGPFRLVRPTRAKRYRQGV